MPALCAFRGDGLLPPSRGSGRVGVPHRHRGGPAGDVLEGAPRGHRRHGERSRLQLLFKLAGTENMLILAVNVLAVNFWLLTVPSPSI